jgi:hypothetical protein|tara:strand:+ start:1095 stop:2516 length:1422 start_codon:yes stop_codon:yes gene_type:complete
MARTHVTLTDTVSAFKTKVNDISYDVGDITLMSTSGADSDVVQAINSLDSDIGGIANLTTTDKSSIKSAINELDAEIGSASLTTSASTIKGAINEHEVQINNLDSDVGTRTSLTTDADQNIVVAINEVDANANTALTKANAAETSLGTISVGVMGTTASTVGAAIGEIHGQVDSAAAVVGPLGDLLTVANSSIVGAINEVKIAGVDSDVVIEIFSAANSGTGYGSLAYGNNGVYTYAKVTNANIRSAISAGEGIDIASGVISGENASLTNKGIASFDSASFDATSGHIGIKAGSLDASLIEDGSITAVKLATNAVITNKLNTSAVTTTKINALAVTTAKIADLNVTTGKVADDAITYAKMQNVVTANRVLGSTSAGGVVSELLITSDLLGADAVNGTKIADDAIGSEHIADDAVTADHIATNAVTADGISAGAVGESEIGDDAVSQAELKDVVTFVIYSSDGTAVKTLYGAGS